MRGDGQNLTLNRLFYSALFCPKCIVSNVNKAHVATKPLDESIYTMLLLHNIVYTKFTDHSSIITTNS